MCFPVVRHLISRPAVPRPSLSPGEVGPRLFEKKLGLLRSGCSPTWGFKGENLRVRGPPGTTRYVEVSGRPSDFSRPRTTSQTTFFLTQVEVYLSTPLTPGLGGVQ